MANDIPQLDALDERALELFPGLVVRKDLLRRMRSSARPGPPLPGARFSPKILLPWRGSFNLIISRGTPDFVPKVQR